MIARARANQYPRVEVQLPPQLPARLTTLNHACTDTQFEKNRWGCPKEAFVGGAVAHTPLLSVPLTARRSSSPTPGDPSRTSSSCSKPTASKSKSSGTRTSKTGSSTRNSKPSPTSRSPRLKRPCRRGPTRCSPATATCARETGDADDDRAQNGRELTRNTNISVSGCPSTNARKLTSSLASCRKTDRGHHKKLLSCEAEARKRYGAKASSKSAAPRPPPASLRASTRTPSHQQLQARARHRPGIRAATAEGEANARMKRSARKAISTRAPTSRIPSACPNAGPMRW